MRRDRREFLKIAGISALVGTGVWEYLSPGDLEAGGKAEIKDDPTKIRWAMTIDIRNLDMQLAQKAIDACHKHHNVPKFNNPKDEIKWIWVDSYHHAFTDNANEYMDEKIKNAPFLLLCNHCTHPPCVRVCPTKATFKRPDGIVAMDYHRCIGCRFCMAGCPYGARSFNWKDPRLGLKKDEINMEYPTRMIGVVEKCNYCVELVEQGKLPKCVEAIPQVLAFGNLNDPNSKVRQLLKSRASIRRKLELGTKPSVFYLV